MNKELIFNYLDDTYNKNKHFYTYKYFKTIKKIFNNIEINEQLTDLALFKTPNVFTQNYDLGNFGLYHIDFNIHNIIHLINNNQLNLKIYKSDKINFNLIYHEYPDFLVHQSTIILKLLLQILLPTAHITQ